jgi:hypothetical protein
MNPISKHYMRLRYQERVDALKKAGKPVTHQTVYDKNIDVGVPVPDFDSDGQDGRPPGNYRASPLTFFSKFVSSGIAAFFRFLVTPRGPTVFEEANRKYFQSGGVAKRLKVSSLFLLTGLAVAAWPGMVVYKGASSSSWPVITGVIRSSELKSSEHRDKGISSTTYTAKLQYEYSVDGKSFTSGRFCFGDFGSSDGKRAQKICSRYPSGTSVQVHYNPAHHEESTIQTGSTWFMNLWLVLGLLLALSGVVGVIRAINAHRIYVRAVPATAAGN